MKDRETVLKPGELPFAPSPLQSSLQRFPPQSNLHIAMFPVGLDCSTWPRGLGSTLRSCDYQQSCQATGAFVQVFWFHLPLCFQDAAVFCTVLLKRHGTCVCPRSDKLAMNEKGPATLMPRVAAVVVWHPPVNGHTHSQAKSRRLPLAWQNNLGERIA